MAKNKNRERKQPQSQRASQAAAQPASVDTQAEQHLDQISPADMARKGRQKRFGHN